MSTSKFRNTTNLHAPTSRTAPQRFLSLHAELRNHILQHALTEAHLLLYIEPTATTKARIFKPIADIQREFNEIKYVCKQLYAETAGLEIKYSTIEFYGDFPAEKGPGMKFLEFMLTCAPTKAAWFHHVELTTNRAGHQNDNFEMMIEPPATMTCIVGFCRANPDLKIAYVSRAFQIEFNRNVYEFFLRGEYLAYVLRHAELDVLLPHGMFSSCAWSPGNFGIAIDVENFQIWPSQRKGLELQEVLRCLEKYPSLVDEFRVVARSWLANGI